MVLKIGILGENSAGWRLLLEQVGIPYKVVTNIPGTDELSVLIVPDSVNENNSVRDYLSNGGAIICSGRKYSQLSGTKTAQTFIKYLLGEKDSKFSGIGMLDVGLVGNIPSHANILRTSYGQFTGYLGEYGGGNVIVLPFDAGEVVLDNRTTTKSFYSNHNRLPFEQVSWVSKGNLLKLVSRSLEILHHQRGLPFVHKWYFPKDSQTIFSWRIDTDYANKREIEHLYNLIKSYEVPATWFVDIKSQKEFLPMFKQMEGQEIGIHCYAHETYEDYERNIVNIRMAIESFANVGLRASGFAAPFGKWNSGISRTINECGFDYSSEFSYDYDNVPSFPIVVEKKSAAMQLPVHPISIGSLRRLGFEESMMIQYYHRLMETKLMNREPVILYHHPKNGNDAVVKSIFEFVKSHNMKTYRMIDYANWWKRRHQLKMELIFENPMLNINVSSMESDLWIRIVQPDGREIITEPQSMINFKELRWMKQPEQCPLPTDIYRIRKFNPWIPMIHLQDKISKIYFQRH